MIPTEPVPTPGERVASFAVWALAANEVIRDDAKARTVLALVVLLVLAAVALAAVTAWFWRTTRPEHPALGPLEVMSSQRFWFRDTAEQVRRLEAARPEGAEPERTAAGVLLPHGLPDPERAIDLEEAPLAMPIGFDDLIEPEPGHEAEVASVNGDRSVRPIDPLLDAPS